MEQEVRYSTSVASIAEDLFVEVFCDAFGPEKTQYLSVQYPFVDIYGNRRFIDFGIYVQPDKDYSPTTMFNDYSESEYMFWWQNQSTTGES